MGPVAAVAKADSATIVMTSARRVRSTGTPRPVAVSSPRVRGPRSRPTTSRRAPHTAIAPARTGTWFQSAEPSEPLSQRMASMALYTLPWSWR